MCEYMNIRLYLLGPVFGVAEEHVFRFQVSMCDVQIVEVFQGLQALLDNRSCFILFKPLDFDESFKEFTSRWRVLTLISS